MMTRFSCLLTFGLSLFLVPAVGKAQTLEADYQLQNTYDSSVGTIGPMTGVGYTAGLSFEGATVNGNNQQVLNISGDPSSGATAGVQVQTAGFGISDNNYSVVLLSDFDLTTPTLSNASSSVLATKVMDFNNLSSDAGLYINDATGLLEFIDGNGIVQGVPSLTINPITSGEYLQLVLTRNGSTGLTSVYENGTLALSFTDSSDLAVLGDSTNSGNAYLTLYQDDGMGLGGNLVDESSEGDIARLRIYNGVLSATQVADLDTTVVPEPAAWALLLGGVGLVIFCHRQRARLA